MHQPFKRAKLMAEINITPFTDVVLVLLIIFMVSTPLLLQPGIKVKLPETATAETESSKTVTVTVAADGRIFVGSRTVSLERLSEEMTAQAASNPDVAVIINADKEVRYEAVVQVLDAAKQAGVRKLALGIERERK